MNTDHRIKSKLAVIAALSMLGARYLVRPQGWRITPVATGAPDAPDILKEKPSKAQLKRWKNGRKPRSKR